jgi:hypothetical protein
MMLGIGLGVMAILCAAGLIAGGGLFMHHEGKDSKDKPAIERSHDHGKTAEPPSGSLREEKKCGTILWVPKDEVRG